MYLKNDVSATRAGSAPDDRNALIVASRRWFREGLKGLLQASGIFSLIDAETLDGCLAAVSVDDHPDVAIVSLEGDDEQLLKDLGTISQWHERLPQMKWVVLCSSLKPAILLASLKAGVDGLFHVDISEDVLRRAVELILLGQTLFPSELSRLLLNARMPTGVDIPVSAPVKLAEPASSHIVEDGPEQHVSLSPREHQILQCLVAGHPNKVIARELDIAEATVKVHIKGLLRKIKASNRTQAAIWAMTQRAGSVPRGSNVVQLPSAALAGTVGSLTEPRATGTGSNRVGFPPDIGLAAGDD